MTTLLKWISEIEQKIAVIGGPRERLEEMRNQINSLKVGILIISLIFQDNFLNLIKIIANQRRHRHAV